MNATRLAQSAYRDQSRSVRTDRGLEYDAFARITQRLVHAAGQDPRDIANLAAALHDNRRLWTILATDVADPQNPLPQSLRAQVVYLAQFCHHHSSAVLNANASLQPLIDINTAIMRGLSDRRADQ
ncbi:Flagellar biosynthesis regulatory protein FlaF [Roseovarius sp. EC-HK134]|uniref:flagellar biosynthesis regulator FlaF n=1 Tax=Roseovarius TaxID=74030 RepID=UPI00125609AE|nr:MULTISPECIES: flagellar biosynthesis regulator FlaF [unclassified Roseovarius]VVT16006.1 Flagellar biosynthesis regulatory protein FlaF [Roseovarius sp. EC-HK134]VVT16565.1 Flagellar biosynthesis regulatory protein FlaF [Roseovarius sp. EC-SD190]